MTREQAARAGAHGFEELLAAAQLGQAWALNALYRSYAGQVTGYVRARTSAEAEDLVSEIFTSVFLGIPRFRGGEPEFRGWLFTIARRRIVDDLRRRSRDVPTTTYDAAADVRAVGSAESASMERLGAEWVRTVLEQLAPDQRDVMLLRIFGDLTVEQVAEALGKSVGAVKQLQRRAVASAGKIAEAEGIPR